MVLRLEIAVIEKPIGLGSRILPPLSILFTSASRASVAVLQMMIAGGRRAVCLLAD